MAADNSTSSSIAVDSFPLFTNGGAGGRKFIILCMIYLAIVEPFVWFINIVAGDPKSIAILGMGTGVILLWILLGGFVMRRAREPLRIKLARYPGGYWWKFALFCTLMACLEEAVTTAMTNTAPLYGPAAAGAAITASANYWEVILFNSVIVFIPSYIAWGLILSRYNFHPNWVFVLYGIQGTLQEVSFGGIQQLATFGFWVLVYGLMVYLPAYCLPRKEGLKKPGVGWHLLALIISGLAIFPWAGLVFLFRLVLGLR